ncbi:GntR family transcriptional regulator [Pseudonocardia spinosispora]|uniref:GntR family transcriptional regulator n=1 Tax=Pseudonocardia spinosispora TaxID=103441 RepID=UPI000409431A|nr:GntR family transcriptional regulator [Pseudonocardia spinosispora]
MAVTRYKEIAAVLEAEIRALPGGERVAGEHVVAQRFGVARSTARAALQELMTRNVIRRVQGSGSFSVRRIDYPIDADRAPSWSATIRAAGASARSVVVTRTDARPPGHVAEALALGSEECHRLVRRSYVDDTPAAWGIEWIPHDVIPDLDAALRADDSLHRVFVDLVGVTPRRAWVRASAEVLDAQVAAALEASPSGLGWFIESLNRDAGTARPLCLTQRWIRSDVIRVVFETQLASDPSDVTDHRRPA